MTTFDPTGERSRCEDVPVVWSTCQGPADRPRLTAPTLQLFQTRSPDGRVTGTSSQVDALHRASRNPLARNNNRKHKGLARKRQASPILGKHVPWTG